MSIEQDRYGIPIIRGDSLAGVAREQGREVARSRGWQIELARLRGEGRSAEILGESALAWDVFARRAMLEEVAKHAYRGLEAEAREFVDAFVTGVNGGLLSTAVPVELDRLGVRPGEWRPWTPLAVFVSQQVLEGGFPDQWWHERLVATIGEEAAAVLRRNERRHLPGGVAWAVGGECTASGRPLVAGMAHGVIESPGSHQQVRLVGPDFDVVGFTLPGVPGVQRCAHAGQVAWGVVDAPGGYQDLYVERLRRDEDTVMAEGPDHWYDADISSSTILVRGGAPVEVELIVTRNGPVIHGGPGELAYSLRTPSFASRDVGFSALVPLLQARTARDVEEAFTRWVEPVSTVVIADATGDIRTVSIGRMPERETPTEGRPLPAWQPGHEWVGWTNEISPDDPSPERSGRRAALLSEEAPIDAGRCARIQLDTWSGAAVGPLRLLAEVVESAQLSPAASRWADMMLTWNGHMDATSRGAGAFAVWRGELVRRIAGSERFARLMGPPDVGPLFEPWFVVSARVLCGLDGLIDDAGRHLGLDLNALAREALEAVSADDPPTWGSRHLLWPVSATEEHPVRPVELSGDLGCLLETVPAPALDDLCLRGPIARYVWDLADRLSGGWVVPLGASGRPDDPHRFDQLDRWEKGELIELPDGRR